MTTQKYQPRTVRQYVVTVRSSILPDNPGVDEDVLERMDNFLGIIKFRTDIHLPAGYWAEVKPA